MSDENDHDKIIRLEEKSEAAEKALRLAYLQSIVAAILAAVALFHK